MERRRYSLGFVINAPIAIIMVYLTSVLLFPQPALAFGLCGFALITTGWMALRILKDPYSTDKNFDHQFYQDRDDIRRCGPD